MNPTTFVKNLASFSSSNVFNPYRDTCDVHDRRDAAARRRKMLRSYLTAAESIGVDTIWMGRDLGYRGGRRTGVALTDEHHLPELSRFYPGCQSEQVTFGPAIAERTAAEIWNVLRVIELRPLLWNVFPYHPHEEDLPFTNRRFTSAELADAEELNHELITWLRIRRIVAIGQDAAQYAQRFGVQVTTIRHPSYGGVRDFRNGMSEIYGFPLHCLEAARQQVLF